MGFPNTVALILAIASTVAVFVFWKFLRTRSQKFLHSMLIPASLSLFLLGFAPVISKEGSSGIALVLLATLALLVVVVLVYFGLAGLIGDLARSKGRSWAAFFWLSILFSPLIMWIIAASISPIPGSAAFITPDLQSTNVALPDMAKEIEKLGSLKEQGLITKAEFEAKKKELLDRI